MQGQCPRDQLIGLAELLLGEAVLREISQDQREVVFVGHARLLGDFSPAFEDFVGLGKSQLVRQDVAQVGQGVDHFRMTGTKSLFLDRERLTIELDGLGDAACAITQHGQIIQSRSHGGMRRPQRLLDDR